MSISIKTNVAPSAVINIAEEITKASKNGNGFEASLENAVKGINEVLGHYASHVTLSQQDFLKLRIKVAMAYQDIREFRNDCDRFYKPTADKTKVDKQVSALWFAKTFNMVKPKKTALQPIQKKYENRKNGIKNAMSDVRACYAKGLRFELDNKGTCYVTGESYTKVEGMEKPHERVEITLMQATKSLTFSQLAAPETPEGGNGGDESVSVDKVAKDAIQMKESIEKMTVEKMSMINRLAIMDMVFAGLTALGMKHDKNMLNEREEIVKLIAPKTA